MRADETDPPPAPYLVLTGPNEEPCRLRLTLVPIVEVPSGTLGPWLALDPSADAELADKAQRCLEEAMACDAVSSAVARPIAAVPAAEWELGNTKVVTPAGEAFYFSPATVCWCDEAGAPRYDCDRDLSPAADMLDAGAVVPAGWVAVHDERLTVPTDREDRAD